MRTDWPAAAPAIWQVYCDAFGLGSGHDALARVADPDK
jgi:hypothetical protein